MSCCVELQESTIYITYENSKKIIRSLIDYIKEKNPHWRWVNNENLLDCCENDNFIKVMEELGYAIYDDIDNDAYKIDYMCNEKLGDDDNIFRVLASFISNGYIELINDDGCRWRYVFNEGEMKEVYPKIIWE